jgi:hypothetical protein
MTIRGLVATMLALALPAMAGQISLRGAVSDSSGAPIPGASITIHWDLSGSKTGLQTNVGIKADVSVKTDAKGLFQAEVPPGFYDLFVSSSGFSPQCRKVRVRQGQVTTYSPKLHVDPLVTQELGDTFR